MAGKRLAAGVIVLVIASIFIGMGLMSGCATTETVVTISPERQKAIDDSLRQIWDRQLNLAWSLGYENYKNKMFSDAIPHLWKVTELDTVKRFPLVYNVLGDSYYKLNVPDSAEIAYRMGSELYPEKAYYHRNLAYILTAKGENEEAIEQYFTSIELDEDPKVDDFRVLGNLLISANRLDEALDVYEKLVQLDPSDVEAQKVYAQILQSTGDIEAFIAQQEEALTKEPDNTRLMFSLGETYFKRGEYEKAIQKFKSLLQLRPEDAFSWEYLGSAQQNIGKYRDAISTYEKVIELRPENVKALCEMASCYRELKQFSKARSVARQAMQIRPGYGLAHIVVGEVYESTVDACVSSRENRKITIDDKLVYRHAYEEYQKATRDPQFADLARRKMEYIRPDIPTKEDEFMHQGKTQARLDCYQWIY
ncbi:tetratricopeptide repeat protein [candidate division KSB1 bacterium]|nr:tetratricopeptide repeat protein [candidate division KSB1 bacterium]